MPMQIFLGVEEVYYGIVQVVNNKTLKGCLQAKSFQFSVMSPFNYLV